MKLVTRENNDGVVLLTMNHGITNPINLNLVIEMEAAFKELENDPGCDGIVVCSNNKKFFSIGWNLPELINLDRSGFDQFYQSFNRLCIAIYTFMKPTVAALTGHAVAGGCILALCCDFRIIAEGRKMMGLNEIKLGVPIPYPGDRILTYLAGHRIASEIQVFGEFYSPEESLNRGLVDEVIPEDDVVPAAMNKIRQISSTSLSSFGIIKKNRVESVATEILEKLQEKHHSFMECWFAADTRERLREATKKF